LYLHYIKQIVELQYPAIYLQHMPQLAICKVYAAHVYKQPLHTAELSTQLLFGNYVQILQVQQHWAEVQLLWNNEIGWLLSAQIQNIEGEDESNYFIGRKPSLATANHTNMLLPAMASLPHYNPILGSCTIDANAILNISPDAVQNGYLPLIKQNLLNILFSYINVPYVWGGLTHAGVDCSGLVCIAYKYFGIALPHNAAAQAEKGIAVDFLQEAQLGDIAYFSDGDGDIHHVGILLNNSEIIHASENAGCVAVHAIDNYGIINNITSKRTHQLRVIKRLQIFE
jgi:gamma-D-glutamyl-L-lysine dipeptidyl-peptidase